MTMMMGEFLINLKWLYWLKNSGNNRRDVKQRTNKTGNKKLNKHHQQRQRPNRPDHRNVDDDNYHMKDVGDDYQWVKGQCFNCYNSITTLSYSSTHNPAGRSQGEKGARF